MEFTESAAAKSGEFEGKFIGDADTESQRDQDDSEPPITPKDENESRSVTMSAGPSAVPAPEIRVLPATETPEIKDEEDLYNSTPAPVSRIRSVNEPQVAESREAFAEVITSQTPSGLAAIPSSGVQPGGSKRRLPSAPREYESRYPKNSLLQAIIDAEGKNAKLKSLVSGSRHATSSHLEVSRRRRQKPRQQGHANGSNGKSPARDDRSAACMILETPGVSEISTDDDECIIVSTQPADRREGFGRRN